MTNNTVDGVEEYEATRAALASKAKAILEAHIAKIFEADPTLHALRWSQYTPYFNDGEECVFQVHDPEVQLIVPDGETDWLDSYDRRWRSDQESRKAFWQRFKAWKDEALEDLFFDAFGDHIEIVVTRGPDGALRYSTGAREHD